MSACITEIGADLDRVYQQATLTRSDSHRKKSMNLTSTFKVEKTKDLKELKNEILKMKTKINDELTRELLKETREENLEEEEERMDEDDDL